MGFFDRIKRDNDLQFLRKSLVGFPIVRSISDGNEVHILTFENDYLMALFSIKTLLNTHFCSWKVVWHQGGFIREESKQTLLSEVPGSEWVGFNQQERLIEEKVPPGLQNRIRYLVQKVPVIRKFFSPLLFSESSKYLVVDSDIVWFGSTGEIENGFKESSFLVNRDNGSYYVRPIEYFGKQIVDYMPGFVNDGIILVQKSGFHWDFLSKWLQITGLEKSGLAPQTLHALLINKNPLIYLSNRYFIGLPEHKPDSVAAWHFAGPTRQFYLEYGVKAIS